MPVILSFDLVLDFPIRELNVIGISINRKSLSIASIVKCSEIALPAITSSELGYVVFEIIFSNADLLINRNKHPTSVRFTIPK